MSINPRSKVIKVNMSISFLYNILLVLLGLLSLPRFLFLWLKYGKYRHSFSKRWGKGFPKIEKQGRFLVWIHAVSVGETKAVAALAKKMMREVPDAILIVSSVTETGHEEAKRSIPQAQHHIFLPFDLPWIITSLVRQAAPDMVVVCESDLWLNFLRAAKRQGAFVALVNGKISTRSVQRYQYIPFFTKALFAHIDLVAVQNEEHKARYLQIGAPPEKIVATGNMKLDEAYPFMSSEQTTQWKRELGICDENQVVVLGSTHYPEEQLLLESLLPLISRLSLKVVVVPRHPERFNEVAELLKRLKIPFHRLAQGVPHTESKVVLVDRMGVLRQCYQIADVAVVGGSYTAKVGGHNILEPCAYGVPVIFGPHMQAQFELADIAGRYNCGKQVAQERLQETIEFLLQNTNERKRLGESGKRLMEEMQGASERNLALMRHCWRDF
jgi:3-deoxy-D-manno-octulosonic-acid transferase